MHRDLPGLEIQFAVETRPADGNSYDYLAEALETVLTREGLYAQLYERYPDFRELRCDALPAVAVVRADEELEQRCYGKPSRWSRTEEIAIIPRQPGQPPMFVRNPD